MGRPAKEGRYVNFYMSAGLFDELVKVASAEGRTKTSILEDALQEYIAPYRNVNGEINPVKAIYKKTGEACLILDTEMVVKRKYYRILLNGEIMSVRDWEAMIDKEEK